MNFRIFGLSYIVSAAALVVAFLYGGVEALGLCLILGILEVSLSFDNAVVNATVLQRMNDFWQKIFLSVGVLIAVFGMRLLFPLIVVSLTAKLSPAEALRLALQHGDPHVPGTYGYQLTQAYPQIAAYGGMFLLMLFLDFIFEEREISWLTWLERPLARIGRLDRLSVVIALVVLVVVSSTLAEHPVSVLLAGSLGLVTYLVVNGLGEFFDQTGDELVAETIEHAEGIPAELTVGPSGLVKAFGKAAFFLFLYLEVLDAAFSFDGVVGAFAITADPVLIALGLGFIGAMFIRSLTVYLVRKGTLAEYTYLEHGAHWAIGALAVILLIGVGVHVDEVVTGLIGVAFIGAAWGGSIVRNRRLAATGEEVEMTADELTETVGRGV
jgi:hypothetical protein